MVFVVASCDTGPQPLVYGKDACHTCKMTLVDNRFGAELITSKGKVFKFDDVNCLVRFYKSGEVDAQSILITDYSKPGELIDATLATYVMSDDVRSPMASNAAVFANKEEAEKFNVTLKGKLMTWNDILTEF
jgi:copper chaperone NosL